MMWLACDVVYTHVCLIIFHNVNEVIHTHEKIYPFRMKMWPLQASPTVRKRSFFTKSAEGL